MGKRDASLNQEQPTQHTAGPKNDSQGSLIQLLAPFVDAAPPGKLLEVVFSLKNLLMRLLAVRNHGASPRSQVSDNEFHTFLQITLPVLVLRRILQKGGSIVSLATTNLPQVREQLSQITEHSDRGRASSGFSRRKIHIVLSRTNHLLSWVMAVHSMKKDVDANEYVCDAKQFSCRSALSSYRQGSMFSTILSETHTSLPGVAALPSYGTDAENEETFPWFSDLTEISYGTLESNIFSTTSAEIGRKGRKNKFYDDFEGDDNKMAILSGLKNFFSPVPSIFLAGENGDKEVSDADDNPCFSQERTSGVGDEESEEEEDLFHDLYAVSYGFDRLENVFFDLYWGFYAEVDVVMGRCIRVIFFSTVDEILSCSQDSRASLFYSFHKELKLLRQSECKDTTKGVVETTEHLNLAEAAHSGDANSSGKLEAKAPLLDPLFSGVCKKLQTELHNQLNTLEKPSVSDCLGINELDKADVAIRLLKEYHEKRSATNVVGVKLNDVSVSELQIASRSKYPIAIGEMSAFTAVVWPRRFSVSSKVDLSPRGHTQTELHPTPATANPQLDTSPDHQSRDANSSMRLNKPYALPSILSVTHSKSQGTPMRGWCSLWTSRYELCRSGADSLSQQDFLFNISCGAESISESHRPGYRKASSLGAGDPLGASLSTTEGNDTRPPNQLNNTCSNGSSFLETHEVPGGTIAPEACMLVFSATSEVWLFYDAAACAGAGNTSTDSMYFSSDERRYGAGDGQQGAPPAFPGIPGGMHQRWVVSRPSKRLPTLGVDAASVSNAVVVQITEHERMVRDSIIRACNGILQAKQSMMGIIHVHDGTGPSLSCLLPRRIPFSVAKTYFDPLRYDESILNIPFHPPSQEES